MMIEMSHTEEDINEADLFTADGNHLAVSDVSRKCNTALEILQNEVINCEKNISLEKSQRELNEKKLELVEQSKKVSCQVAAVHTSRNECDDHVENIYPTIFNNDQFSELIENIMRVGNHFNGIEEDDVQKIIFEFAELNEINHGFDKTLRKTENEWFQRFIQSHPNLNSVIKKSFNDSVQLHRTDIEFSSRIVDKFVSDYKSSKRYGAKFEQSSVCENLGNEKYTDVSPKIAEVMESSKPRQKNEEIWSKYDESVSSRVVNDFEATNRNESDNFLNEKNDSTAEVGCTENTTAHVDLKQSCFHVLGESLSSSCLADSPKHIEREEVSDAVSSLRSINFCVEDECFAKRNLSSTGENISNKQLSDSLENYEAKKCDTDEIVEVNSTNLEDLSPIITCDSDKFSLEKSFAISTEASRIETKKFDDDCNINVFNCANKKSGDEIFFGNPINASNVETLNLKPKTAENLEKLKNIEEDPFTNDDSNFDKCDNNNPKIRTEFSLATEIVTGEKSNAEIHLKTTCTSVPLTSAMSASKPKETDFSKEPRDKGDDLKPKIVKKKRSLNKKMTKKAKNFMKPVIKLTKLEEASFKNSNRSITRSPNTSAEQEVNEIEKMETNFSAGNDGGDEVGADIESDVGIVEKHEVIAESITDISNDSKDEVETKMNYNVGNDLKDEVETKANSYNNDSNDAVEAETNYNISNDWTNHDKMEMNYNVYNDSKDEAEADTKHVQTPHHVAAQPNSASNISKDEVLAETNSNSSKEFENEIEDYTNPDRDNISKEVETKVNSEAGGDTKGQITKLLETTAEKSVSRLSNEKKGTPTLKMNSTNERVTPTFGMQTRRKRLKFLPDGTLVTPNQRHQHFLEDLSSSSRSESKTAKKRCLKTPPQDTPKPEKKMKITSASSTPKQASRSTVSTKKVSRSRPDRYIPETNGKSKKPQKIFDYDSYYRENFRETEVKLPPSCKKQMVALSRVTSISPATQSGGQFTVNPAQLLSCLLGMPVTPDQIRTVRFKPPVKQLKPNKQIDITSSKLASSDAIKPITKRHLEVLQKTPFSIVPKTEIGVTKSNIGTKSKPVTQ